MEGTAITLLLFGLLFLVVDLALALFTKATLQSAVRAGVRLAVTEQLGSQTLSERRHHSNGPAKCHGNTEWR